MVDPSEFFNVPVIKGNITTGISSRGVKMIFLNKYGYLYMSTTKEMISWCCARRADNCKAVIYTVKNTGEVSHCNGMFHSHEADPNKSHKRNIIEQIIK